MPGMMKDAIGRYVRKTLAIVTTERRTYDQMLFTSRDGRSSPLTRIGTDVIAMPF